MTLTVRQLYEKLDELRPILFARPDLDTMEVIVRVADDDCGGALGGLIDIEIDPGCTEVDSLIFDGSADAESRYKDPEDEDDEEPIDAG